MNLTMKGTLANVTLTEYFFSFKGVINNGFESNT